MAALYSNSTGNFTAAGTWSLIDSASYTATTIATQETGTTNSTTTFTSSTNFTPGAITVDGIALKISSRSASPTGTFSVRLFNATLASAVAGTTVTVNVSDIPNGIGWVFFKFSSPVTLAILTNYNVQVSSTTNNQVQPFRKSATAADWTIALRTTTTQAPAAGDTMIVGGEWLSAGSNNAFTITMDNTAATLFGSGTTGTAGIECNSLSTFAWGVAASTAYQLRLAGNLYINNAATYTQGTGATPIPSTSSGSFEIVGTSNVQFGIEARAGSTLKSGGNAITNSALLAADAAISATSLTTNVSTGWLSGDVIALASTTRTRTEAESKALTANASGTTLTIAALANAHSGTSPTQAELINLTRNVKIFGTSTANQAYVNINATATVDFQTTEFYNMGSATANKRGIDVGTTTGSYTMNNCSVHDFVVTGSFGTNLNSASGNNYTITNTVMYALASNGINQSATTQTNYTINNVIVIGAGQQAAAVGINLNDLGGTLTNLTGTSSQGSGISMSDTATRTFGTISNLTGHSNSTVGVQWTAVTGGSNNPMGLFSTIVAWRNNTTGGLQLTNSFNFIVDGVTAFGNNTANVHIGGTECDNVYLKNMTINAGTTLVSPVGINLGTDCHELYLDNCTFGGTTTHSTGDINVSAANLFVRLVTRNTTLSSSTQVSNTGNMIEGSFISLAKLGTTAGNHKTFKKYGTIVPDTTIFNKQSPSVRLTPNNASSANKLQSTGFKVPCPSGQTATAYIYMRKSVAGDGSAYNGNQPRIMLRADPAIGVTSDTVLFTLDNTFNGAWKQILITTPTATDNAVFQIYIDCDGTAGWVNFDDFDPNS